MEARGKLIEHNLRLVAHVVRKYYASAKDEEDLVSIGTVGLIKSVDSFNPDNGARFATYAARCIQNEILMYFRSQKKLQMEVSMEETIETDQEGNALTYEDVVAVEDTIADDLDARMKYDKAIRYVTRGLEPREREILVMRYGPPERRGRTCRMGYDRTHAHPREHASHNASKSKPVVAGVVSHVRRSPWLGLCPYATEGCRGPADVFLVEAVVKACAPTQVVKSDYAHG